MKWTSTSGVVVPEVVDMGRKLWKIFFLDLFYTWSVSCLYLGSSGETHLPQKSV